MARPPREPRKEDPRVFQYWRPEEWDVADAAAIQAIVGGKPNSDQCARFIRWLERATMLYAQTYSPLSDRDSAFAEGMRKVGRRFVILSKLNLAAFRKGEDVSEKE